MITDGRKAGYYMNVRNCRRCRKIFNYTMGPLYCMTCRQELEEEFQVVKKFVQDNPGCDIRIVSEACNVEPNKIREWVREERLYFSEGSNTGISCERCGVMIQTGRFCNRCKSEMTNTFRSAITPAASASAPAQKNNSKVNPKMRYLDSDQ